MDDIRTFVVLILFGTGMAFICITVVKLLDPVANVASPHADHLTTIYGKFIEQ